MWTKDPAYEQVACHLPFTGANGSTTFTDFSKYGIVPILTGDVSISTAQSKYAGSSARFNGGRLRLNSPDAFGRIAGVRENRTIQFWMYVDAIGSTQTVMHLPATTGASNDILVNVGSDGSLQYRIAGSAYSSASGLISAGQWYHVAVVRGPYNGDFGGGYPSGYGTLSINGVLRVSFAGGSGSNDGGPELVIGSAANNTQPFIGYLQDFQFSNRHIYSVGGSLNSFLFTPPDGLLPTTLGVDQWGELQTDRLFAVAPMPQGSVSRVASPMRREANWYFGGDGRIVGTVKEKSLPTNLPLSRKVRLFREFDGIFVAEVWSDAAGNYTFDRIDQNFRYTIISYDYAQNYRAVVADNILPEARS